MIAVLVAVCGPQASAGPAATDRPTATNALISFAPKAASPPAGAPSAQPAVRSGTVMIDMGDHFYSPSLVTVTVGTRVVWTNVGQSSHDTTARDRSFGSPLLSFGGTYSFTFTAPGRYPYYCTIHEGDGMFGEVDVQ